MQISIIGAGNVAYHLAKAFFNSGVPIDCIYTSSESGKHLAEEFNSSFSTDISSIEGGKLVLIAVPDDQINSVIEQLSDDCFIAYTSGSVELSALPNKPYLGVFYPLQTFSKNRQVQLENVPILLESNNIDFLNLLEKLANIISGNVRKVNSENRSKLHVAAVWLNNFTNHMLYQSETFCKEHNLDIKILYPLLIETIGKAIDMGAFEAQTGPARRGDKETINRHLNAMNHEQRQLYMQITNSIIKTYGGEEL